MKHGVRCLAFAEHAPYAQAMTRTAAEALAAYSRWFGPYPYPEFTIVEAFPGWGGQACAAMIAMDERVFAMPHSAAGVAEALVAEQTCRQWWYNTVGRFRPSGEALPKYPWLKNLCVSSHAGQRQRLWLTRDLVSQLTAIERFTTNTKPESALSSHAEHTPEMR